MIKPKERLPALSDKAVQRDDGVLELHGRKVAHDTVGSGARRNPYYLMAPSYFDACWHQLLP
jgi:hypothetical protein